MTKVLEKSVTDRLDVVGMGAILGDKEFLMGFMLVLEMRWFANCEAVNITPSPPTTFQTCRNAMLRACTLM